MSKKTLILVGKFSICSQGRGHVFLKETLSVGTDFSCSPPAHTIGRVTSNSASVVSWSSTHNKSKEELNLISIEGMISMDGKEQNAYGSRTRTLLNLQLF